jgi:hypothetical protein
MPHLRRANQYILFMALVLPEQLKTLIENKKHILVTFRPDAAGDAIGSAIALALMIERMGRMVDIISADFVLPKAYSFLPLAERINGNFSHLQIAPAPQSLPNLSNKTT